MRTFFKTELKTLYAKTQLRQYETISAMPDAADQFKILLDSLEHVCRQFNYIPETAQQNIIRERILSDKDFIGLNAKVVYKWFMEVRDTYFKESAHIKEADTPNPVTYEELSPETKAKVDEFIRGLQSESAGLKSVPHVTQKEIDDIKLEDMEQREGKRSISAGYQTNPEIALMKAKQHEWRLECFDLITGKPNDKYFSFDEWLRIEKTN